MVSELGSEAGMSVTVSGYVQGLFDRTQVWGVEEATSLEAWRCLGCKAVFVGPQEALPPHECTGLTVKPPPVDQEQFARRLKESRASNRPVKVNRALKG
jgi:hypothetical protein